MAPSTAEPTLPTAPVTASSTSAQAAQAPQLSLPSDLPIPPGDDQMVLLLQHIPGLISKVSADGTIKRDYVIQLMNNLGIDPNNMALTPGMAPPGAFPPPFSAATDAARGPSGGQVVPGVSMPTAPPQAAGGADSDDDEGSDGRSKADASPTATPAPARRGRSGLTMGSDEWTRQRKDNHKEVERRRRSNINEGINELGRIVPNGSGEKSKGAILSRAVQYIHHLKENEARNIEKWTLEKLLMDQAMGDLQSQLDEVRNMWTEERNGRQRAEAEVEALRNGGTGGSTTNEPKTNGTKRPNEDADNGKEEDGKRQRTE